MTDSRPTIVVAMNDGLTEAHLAEVFHGIEEEGIPYSVRILPCTDARDLAHSAAIESRLGVGVGAADHSVVVTTEKLPARQPYITQPLNSTPDLDRVVGQNAARLTKRIPLLTMSN